MSNRWIGRSVWWMAGLTCAAGIVAACSATPAPPKENDPGAVGASWAAGSCTPIPVVTVSASGDDGNEPENAIDGNSSTRWSSLGKGQWLRLDLGTAQEIEGAEIAWYKGKERTNNFVLETSNNGTSWTQSLSAKSSGKTAGAEGYAFTSTARYVRVKVNGNSDNDWASISEITVCSDTSGAASAASSTSGGSTSGGGSCAAGPANDKNGVSYVSLPGFTYVGGEERFDWTENFKSNGSMRHDFEGTAEGNQCAVGYFIVEGPNDEELSIKLGGGPHSDDNPEYADTYDLGVVNFAGNRSRLRFEETHPDYSDSIPGLSFSFGSLENKWVGVMGCKLNLDDNADGEIDRVWVVAWVDPQGLDAQGKPKNAWTKVFDKKIDLDDVELKSPTEPYVATIGKPQLAQATLRIDEQNEDDYQYRYIAYRSPVPCD
ncbi:MAG: discoidin domain-containing protein [Polyangiaceae bacterium]